jgi:hypothetical protein
MDLADGREIKFNEIVGNPVSQHGIPSKMASGKRCNRETLQLEHLPGDQGLAVIALFDVIIVYLAPTKIEHHGSAETQDVRHASKYRKFKNRLPPLLEEIS